MTISKKQSSGAGVTACGATSEINLKLEAKIKEQELIKAYAGPVSTCQCGAEYRLDGDLYDKVDGDELTEELSVNGCPHCIVLDAEADNTWSWENRNNLVEHYFDVAGVPYKVLHVPVNYRPRKVTKTKDGVYKINGVAVV